MRKSIVSLVVILSASASANDYKNTPRVAVDLNKAPQFSVVGQLTWQKILANGDTVEYQGSGTIISPCYVLTNYHVIDGAVGEIRFRAGQRGDPGMFAGDTTAAPAMVSDYHNDHTDDWAIMRLHQCAGRVKGYGWAEITTRTTRQLIAAHTKVGLAGYSYKTRTNARMSYSTGTITGLWPYDHRSMMFSASMTPKQSGSPLFAMEDGIMKLVGLNTAQVRGYDASGKEIDIFPTYSIESANLAQGVFEILNRPEVKALLDADKATVGANPTLYRLSAALPAAVGCGRAGDSLGDGFCVPTEETDKEDIWAGDYELPKDH